MKNLTLILLITLNIDCVWADNSTDCTQNAGTYLVGTVQGTPKFKKAKEKVKGVWLSHTHVSLLADGNTYDVAIDNVFADGYVKNSTKIPSSLNKITDGTKLEVCGKPFPGGIDWVHTNCGETASQDKPNGWVKIIDNDGSTGDNLEAKQDFCYLWN